MIFLFLRLLPSFDLFAAAVPTPVTEFSRAIPISGLLSLPDGSTCSRRLMFNIVWGCLSTMFLCAWVSIHPNIPKPQRHEGLYRRLQLLFWMLVAPELILIFSMRQWVGAGQIANLYNNTRLKESKRKLPKWTRAHGHFIIMGGLTLVNPAPEEKDAAQTETDQSDSQQLSAGEVMSYEQFVHFVNDPTFDFPIMTEADINDRTRGDGLSKSIAVLQTSWFIVQCIARAVEHRAVTELELSTLGLCPVTLITYIFWWHKPLDAKTQIPVYLKPGQKLLRRDDDTNSFDSTTGIWGERGRRGLLRRIKELSTSIRDILTFDPKETPIRTILYDLFLSLPYKILFLIVIILATPSVLLFCGMASITGTSSVIAGASHVPPYYAPSTGDGIPSMVFAVFGALFGGIHVIGWNFTYPSLVEKILWQAPALLVTVIPTYIVFAEYLLRYSWGFEPHTPESRHMKVPKRIGARIVFCLAFLAVILLVLYVFARLSLLLQSFILLRKQPTSAFCTVNWLTFFPHLS